MTTTMETGSIDNIAEREFSVNPVSVVTLLGKGPYGIPKGAHYVNFANNRIRFWEKPPENNHAYSIPENVNALYLPELHLHGGRHTQYGEPKFK